MQDIFHITVSHSRYDSRIFERICKSLSKYKLNIKLIVFDGLGYEEKENIKIIDLGVSKISFLKIFINHIKIFMKLRNKNSILHFHEPILLPMALLLKLCGNKVIFDMHENLHLQIMIKDWPFPKYLKKIISIFYRKTEDLLLKGVDGLIVAQPIMINMYKNHNKNIISIANFYLSENEKDNNLNNILMKKNYKDLIYSGTISKERGFLNMIKLMSCLSKEYKLHIAGKVNNNFKKKIPKSLKNNIILYGHIEFEDLKKLYNKCGIGLIMFNNVGQYYMSYSLKLFEYMYFGLYVLMPNFGEWKIFNENFKAGLSLDPIDPKKYSKILKRLDIETFKTTSKRNFKNARKYFVWENEVNKLINFYEKI